MEQADVRFAVLIDADNVSPKYIKYILEEVSDLGIATYKRIYGDWTDQTKRGWKQELLEYSVNPIQQYSYTTGKNATDSALIIDAMDILYSNRVDAFCLVSSDSDFTKLAQRLREAGMFVLGMGERKTPRPFIKACDTFKILEVIAQEDEQIDLGCGPTEKKFYGRHSFVVEVEPTRDIPDKVEITDIKEINKAIFRIVTDKGNHGKATGMAELGNMLSKRFPDFDVRNYGYSKLSTFLKSLDEFEFIKSGTTYYIKEKKEPLAREEIESFILELMEKGDGKIENMSLINEELKKKYPGFNIKQYGYSRVSSFVRSFPRFEIELNEVRLK